MPIKRSLGCARIVLRDTMLASSVNGAIPPMESLLMRIALTFPFPNAASGTLASNSCSESALSSYRSRSYTSSSCGNTYRNLSAVCRTSRSFNPNKLVVKGILSRSLVCPHYGDSEAFLHTRDTRRWKLSSLVSCHKYGFSFSKYASTSVEIGTEILTRGKSWKGRGWNRAPSSEVLAVVSGTEGEKDSIASQFDNIPDLEEKLKFLETCGLGDNQLVQMRKRLPSAVKNTFLKLSMKKLIEVATFLDEEVGVEKKDFGNLLFANPYIAGSSVEECLRPKVEFLRQRGITKEEMGKMVLRSPQILTYSLEGKLVAIEQKLLEVGLKDDEIGRVFVRYPALIGTSIGKFDKNVQSLKEAGISEVARAIFKIPQVMFLLLKLSHDFWPLLHSGRGPFLGHFQVGEDEDQVPCLVKQYCLECSAPLNCFQTICPRVIGEHVEDCLKKLFSLVCPVQHKLKPLLDSQLAMSAAFVIMSLSLDSKYKGILQFLQDELHLQSDQISKIVSSQISILSFSVETNIRPKVGFFIETGLKNDDIARLVVKYPNIFCHSLEKSIKPKVQYLVQEMKLQVMELISFPHYLSYSLADRIIPRHEYVSKYGFSYRLSSLLSCCDNVFHKRYPKPPSSALNGENLVAVR